MSDMNTQEPVEVRLVLPKVATVWHVPGVADEATGATVAALQAGRIHFDVIDLDAEDLDRITWPEQEHEWPVVQISSGKDSNSVDLEQWSGHQPEKIIAWGQKMATMEEEEIESIATFMLTAVVSHNRGSHQAANELRASEAKKMIDQCLNPHSTHPTAETYMLPIHRLVLAHHGDVPAVLSDPQLGQALDIMLANDQLGLTDSDGKPIITAREVVSFMRGTFAIEREAAPAAPTQATTGPRTRSRAEGTEVGKELSQEMHFGVEGYSKEDNEHRLEEAQAVKAVMWRDASDSFVEPFSLTSVIKHGGNLSEVVNDPSLYDDLHKTLAFSHPHWDERKNQDFFDAILTHLRTTEQYGTDKVLQKAMQAASFASSQQRFPISHSASSEGRTTNQVRTSVTAQQTQKNQGRTTAR